jgi:hypothetical protein
VVKKTDQGMDAEGQNLVALSFKVEPEFRKRFRRAAVDADLSMVDLLRAALEAFEREQNNGKSQAKTPGFE